jgi:ketosteroid isomerase-like protein
MKTNEVLKLVLTSVLLFGFASAFAEQESDDPADVWSVIEEEWNANEKGDTKWPDRLLAEDFTGWGKESPAPRDVASTKLWNRFSVQTGKMLAHELYPLSIVVHDDVAIAHYLYRSAFQPKGGDIAMSNGRYTDILVRTDAGWKFLAWHGGDDD